MWRRRDKNKMGLRTQQRELLEKIEEKKQEPLVQRLFKTLDKKLDDLKKEIQGIKDRDVIVNIAPGSDLQNSKTEQKTNKGPVFIPSVDTEDLKVNAGNVSKRKRKVDVSKTVDQLKDIDNT